MPQMAPINWLFWYFIFITIFIMLMIVNYSIFLYPPKVFKKTVTKPTVTWKW